MNKALAIFGSVLLSIQSSFIYAQSPVVAKHGMVVSEQHLASEVGATILRSGGNAIDAAVAVGYALAVVDPCCGNIGGGGFMTLHLTNGKNIFLNFRERAPIAATPNMFLDAHGNSIPNKSTYGYLSVAVPGTVLGFETALKKYGTMSRAQVIAPAIELAEKGYVLTPGDIKLFAVSAANFKRQPNVAAIFLKNGQPYQTGDRLVQKDLSQTLKLISDKGADVFYKGKIAEEIVKASQEQGGILSLKDFADYSVEELSPVTCTYHDYKIISAPPPSSGGTSLCEMLNILERYPLREFGYYTPRSVHYIVEAMRFSFSDRNNKLGDPDFVSDPVALLTSKKYAKQIQQEISSSHATPSAEMNVEHEGVNTTHYSIVDKFGNAASVTYTLNGFFGAQVIADNTGFFLNDEMDDFTIEAGTKNQFGLVQGVKNSIQPGKRPLSSMTPTIVMKNNKVLMVLGSPGGPRIITSTLLAILNVLEYGKDIQQAVDAKRFHHQWLPDVIDIENDTFPPATINKLSAMGYHFVSHNTWGAVEAIYINPKTKLIYGANDMRRPEGAAAGY